MKVSYSTQDFKLTDDLEKYANNKIARLVKKVPRRLRPNATFEITFGQVVRKADKLNTCSVGLAFGDVELLAKETTQHMYAALDIAAAHIEQQLKNYSQTQRHRLLGRSPRIPDQ